MFWSKLLFRDFIATRWPDSNHVMNHDESQKINAPSHPNRATKQLMPTTRGRHIFH